MGLKSISLEIISIEKNCETYQVNDFLAVAINFDLFRSVKSWGGKIIDVDPILKSEPSEVQYVTLTIEAPPENLERFWKKLDLLIERREYLNW